MKEGGRKVKQDGESTLSRRQTLFSYLPAAEILEEKKIQGGSHTTAVATMQKDGIRRIFSGCEAVGEKHAARLRCITRSPEENARPASSHSYLHDDVKGQVEQQVADEDAQHVEAKSLSR